MGCIYPNNNPPVNLHQQEALKAHVCVDRTYYFEGSCYPVSDGCNSFDPLSGRCSTCAIAGQTVQANGMCGSPSLTVTCATGTSLVGSVCVSDSCDASNPDGSCASCKSLAEQVQSGSCVPKTCPTGQTLDSATGNCNPINNCPQGQF